MSRHIDKRPRLEPGFLVLVVCAWFLLSHAGAVRAAIVVDNTGSFSDNSSSFTFPHTIGAGIDPALVVGVSIFSANKTVASITYAGLPLTQIGAIDGGSGANNRRMELWYLVAPPAGTDNVVVTMTTGAKVVIGAASFFGVDPLDPIGTFVSNEGSGTLASVTASSAAGEVVVDCIAVKGAADSVIADPGQTQLWNDVTRTNGGNIMGAGSYAAGASSVTTSWTLQSAEYWVMGAVPLRPAPPPPYLVDAMIKLDFEPDTAYLADAIYEDPVVTQVKSQGVLSGVTAVYTMRFENDGANDDRFLITGTSSAAGFTVQYLDGGGVDRTTDVTGSGYLDALLTPGTSTVWTVRVTPDGSPTPVPGGSSNAVVVTAASSGDPLRVDQVEAMTSSTSPNIAMTKSADKGTAAPGEDITYTVVAASAAGLSDALVVVVVDSIPADTGYRLGSATFDPGTSGLVSTISYSNDNGASWGYTPVDGSCTAPVGYDYCVTHVRWTLTGVMPASRSFTVGFAVRVK